MQVRNFNPTNNYTKQNYAYQQSFTSKVRDDKDLQGFRANLTKAENLELDRCIFMLEHDGKDNEYFIYNFPDEKGCYLYMIPPGSGEDWRRVKSASSKKGLDAFKEVASINRLVCTSINPEWDNDEKIKASYSTRRNVILSLAATALLASCVLNKCDSIAEQKRDDFRVENMTNLRQRMNEAHSDSRSIRGVDHTYDEKDVTNEVVNFYSSITSDLPLDYRMNSVNNLINGQLDEYLGGNSDQRVTFSWGEVVPFENEVRAHLNDLKDIEGYDLSNDRKRDLAGSLVVIRNELNHFNTGKNSVGGTTRTGDEDYVKDAVVHLYKTTAKDIKEEYIINQTNKFFRSELDLYEADCSADGSSVFWDEYWSLENGVEKHVDMLNKINKDKNIDKEAKKFLADNLTNLRAYLNEANSSPQSDGGAKRTENEEFMSDTFVNAVWDILKDIPKGEKRNAMIKVINGALKIYTAANSEGESSHTWKEFYQFLDELAAHKKDIMSSEE